MMSAATSAVLIFTVLAVGVLHTLVPDHWAPIAVLARQAGWSRARTARAAALAGVGHVTSTLLLGVIVWSIGAVFAARYAHDVDVVAGLALVAFGAWIAIAGWREGRNVECGPPGHEHFSHAHPHRHDDGTEHAHWHEHHVQDWHDAGVAVPHEHAHGASSRTALLLVIGSSPMVEGLPAFFAASHYGAGLLIAMAIVFAAATVVTYVAVSVAAIAGLERMSFGRIERYGEALSGVVVMLAGIYALFTA